MLIHRMRIFGIIQTKKLLLLTVFTVFVVVALIAITRNSPINDIDRKYRLEKIDELIRNEASMLACKQPKLPVFSQEMMKFVHDVSPIDCTQAGMDWVKCERFECRVQDQIKMIHGAIKCGFTDIIRVDDYKSRDGETTYSDSYYKLEASDVVKVSCKSESGQQWSATLTGIRYDKEVWRRASWNSLPAGAIKHNVLMFGFDSTSRNSFIRKLPKSYEYLTNVLHGDILEGYNIIGDGTHHAVIPILTGKTKFELPDTRKRFPNTKFVNTYPFIWNDYKDAGYVTAFFDDAASDTQSIFSYQLNGFNETPTDHYMRPYCLASIGEEGKWGKLCTGDTPRYKIMLNQIKNFFNVYKQKPKFLFGFHAELSHDDPNLIGVADNDLTEFLRDLHESRVLDNTVLILMSDHGHRFAEIRNTIQGKQEERLPFFSFTFPASFKKHFKPAYENFQSNINKLTTPFDIHHTLKSMLNLDNTGAANISYRSVSLFTRIPSQRSCAHAYIEPHWCACLEWIEIKSTSPVAKRLTETLVAALNNYTEPHRDICEVWTVKSVDWLMKLAPNDKLIKFKKSLDYDLLEPDLTANSELKTNTYQVKLTLEPGMSKFEASITYFVEEDKFEVKMSDISRTNMYRKQARCVENELPQLRKYCYCKY